jgi:hypothetical protein
VRETKKIVKCHSWLLAGAVCVGVVLGGCDWEWEWCDDCDTWDSGCPLVLSFDGQDVRAEPTSAEFELGADGGCSRTDWPSAVTPWLVRDLDGNGTIDGGHELFGTATRMPDGSQAPNGFVALSVLDEDGDGWITPRDSAWSSLALWSDHDGNKRTDPGELQSLDEAGVIAISLDYFDDERCDDRGNCAVEHAPFLWKTDDGSTQQGTAIDIHLVCR